MENEYLTMVLRLVFSLFAGGLIGLERSYHGRPAGFRTHTLVCTASTVLMLFSANQWEFVTDSHMKTVRIDPTRMAQGIMTGIGFLGAGVIMKENLAIRGLTTAASIWMTASIGIIIGIGFYFPAAVAFLMTLGVLSLFRWIEDLIPSLYFGRLSIRFLRNESISEQELCEVINKHNITCTNLSYHLNEKGKSFQYQMTVRSKKSDSFQKLAETLNKMDRVHEFSIVPTGD
jgi:putative Mg2+ transporter-C (MgtC) family protein|tara:strand:- start:1000 stop:1692 length:693 start_codon:yes stop_codon:yes gene_type:complete